MSKERRNAYRVAVAGAKISAEIDGESGHAVGYARDLSLHGATICISLDQSPSFFVGEMVTLSLHSTRMRPVEVIATVQARTEHERFRRFGVAFANPAVLHAKLGTGLMQFFNERAAFRAEPLVTLPVSVQVPDHEFTTTGQIRDISADGVGIVIDRRSEKALSRVREVRVEFKLPSADQQPTVLRASIRHRSRLHGDDAVYVGLLFDPDTSSDFSSQQQKIIEYVTALQGDLLQQLVVA